MKNIGPIGDKHCEQLQIELSDGSVITPPPYINNPIPCPCGCGATTTWHEEIAGAMRAMTDVLANEAFRGNFVTRLGMSRIFLTILAGRNVVPAEFHAPKPGAAKPH